MGAINAAVLVSNVANRHKTWTEAVKVLEDFWINERNGSPLLQILANGCILTYILPLNWSTPAFSRIGMTRCGSGWLIIRGR